MRRLNILFFIPNLTKRGGGIFQYSLRVLESLRNSQHHIVVLGNSEYERLKEQFADCEQITIEKLQFTPFERLCNKLRRVSGALHREFSVFPEFPENTISPALLKKYQIDFIHSPTQSFPIGQVPFVFTLHDVQELHMPENFSPLEREVRAQNNRLGCENAMHIIVSYEHVKQDLIRFFNIPEERIEVVFIGTSDHQLQTRENAVNDFDKFMLYPAATWPHKNHIQLIRAFEKAKSRHPEITDYRLIFTGHLTPYAEEITAYLKTSKVSEDVKFKGVVSEGELKALYHRAAAVVVPTRYEAGSFPLMEALVQHIPVICSNVTSLPETMGDAKFVFDPDDIDDMADKIYKILVDQSFRAQSIHNAQKQSQKLLNPSLGKAFDDMYNKLAKQLKKD